MYERRLYRKKVKSLEDKYMKVRGLVRTMDGWMVDVKRESQNFHINHDNVDFTEEF